MMRATRLNAIGVLGLVFMLGAAASPPDSPVADAAMRQDVEKVRALVEQGADVDAAQGDGMTALHWAAENGQAGLAELLLSAGARLDPVTRNGAYTPLHLASRSGDAEMIGLLLEAGSDPNTVTASGGATALHFASRAGNPQAVAVLLEGGASPNSPEHSAGQTPLMWAAADNRAAVVQTLLQHGADASLATRVLHYPVIEAVDDLARKHRDSIFDVFREAEGGSETWRPSPEQVQLAVKSAQRLQRSPPAVEADEDAPAKTDEGFAGYTQMVGAQGGTTALLYAVREGNLESALALLDAGRRRESGERGETTRAPS